jgi:hypothetical protein
MIFFVLISLDIVLVGMKKYTYVGKYVGTPVGTSVGNPKNIIKKEIKISFLERKGSTIVFCKGKAPG